MGWRYLAQRLLGDGAGEWLDVDIPLSGVSITDTLSGPAGMSAKLSPEISRLIDATGQPLFEEWSTAFYAEADGQIRAGAILSDSKFNGVDWDLECVGFAGYPTGMPYTESWFGVEIDPLDVVREIWRHLQAQPDGNIGMELDDTLTGLQIGTALTQDEFDTQEGPLKFESGPIQLNWYSTTDLGAQIDELAKGTPFDYHELHEWNGDNVRHRLMFGFPRIGRRRDDLRFVIGENIATVPSVQVAGTAFANNVLTLGAGEGRDMVRGSAAVQDGRLRRVAVVTDKSLNTAEACNVVGRTELGFRQNLADVTEIQVRNHPHAPVGSWDVGDEIRLMGDTGWASVDLWVRVLSSTVKPEEGDSAVLSVIRADKIGTL